MITYNHADYIIQALESVVMQDYPGMLEVLIYDDKSTDSTQELIKSFISKNQREGIIWRPLMREENVGVARNFAQVISDAKGEYIAILEGDDYWIDSRKLSLQYELLNGKPEYVLCHSLCQEVDFQDSPLKAVGNEHPKVTDLAYVLRVGWFYRTATLFFRNNLVEFPVWYESIYSTDYVLHLLLLEKGKAVRLDNITAAYRRHPAGVSSASAKTQRGRLANKLDFLDLLSLRYGDYVDVIDYQKQSLYSDLIKTSIKTIGWDLRIIKHFTISRSLFALRSLFKIR